MNLKFNKKNYKSNLVEFSEFKTLYIIFNNYFFRPYRPVDKKIFMPLMRLETKINFLHNVKK